MSSPKRLISHIVSIRCARKLGTNVTWVFAPLLIRATQIRDFRSVEERRTETPFRTQNYRRAAIAEGELGIGTPVLTIRVDALLAFI